MIESVVVFNCFVEVMLCSISLLSRSITCPTALQSTSLHFTCSRVIVPRPAGI